MWMWPWWAPVRRGWRRRLGLRGAARDRLGGRAHTVTTSTGYPVDLGCGWLHSADRNPWVPIARALGFGVDETLPGWGSRLIRMGYTEADQTDWFRTRE